MIWILITLWALTTIALVHVVVFSAATRYWNRRTLALLSGTRVKNDSPVPWYVTYTRRCGG